MFHAICLCFLTQLPRQAGGGQEVETTEVTRSPFKAELFADLTEALPRQGRTQPAAGE